MKTWLEPLVQSECRLDLPKTKSSNTFTGGEMPRNKQLLDNICKVYSSCDERKFGLDQSSRTGSCFRITRGLRNGKKIKKNSDSPVLWGRTPAAQKYTYFKPSVSCPHRATVHVVCVQFFQSSCVPARPLTATCCTTCTPLGLHSWARRWRIKAKLLLINEPGLHCDLSVPATLKKCSQLKPGTIEISVLHSPIE